MKCFIITIALLCIALCCAIYIIKLSIRLKCYKDTLDAVSVDRNHILDKDELKEKVNRLDEDNGRMLCSYLSYIGIRSVAIYGFGDVGKKLYHYFLNNGMVVDYVIDNKVTSEKMKILTINDDLPETDAIIVTLSYGYDRVCRIISEKNDGAVLPIVNLIDEMYKVEA